MMLRWMNVLCVCAAPVLVSACSSSSSSGGSGGDGGGGTSANVDCSPVPNVGQTVPPQTHAGPPPAMTGGTLVEGTYITTGLDEYNGTTASSSHKEVLIFANGTVKNEQSIGGSPDQTIAGTYTTSGNTLTFNIQCPQTATVTATYTATATQLMFITSDNPNKVETWTKQ